MPFASKAQQRFMFSQHPGIAKRWAKETPDIKDLPQHVSGFQAFAHKRKLGAKIMAVKK